MPNLIWFRRDLRLYDQPALSHACLQATDGVIGLFIMTPTTWVSHAIAPVQIDFMLQNLQVLSTSLQKINIPLLIREVASFNEVPDLLASLTRQLQIKHLYFNRQYEWDEQQRDLAVINKLSATPCQVHTFDDQVIIPPEKILTQQGQAFKVFTPFKNRWLTLANDFIRQPFNKPKAQKPLTTAPDQVPTSIPGFDHTIHKTHIPLAGETPALKQLKNFCQQAITSYQQARDFPALNATSHLSPYLALGVLSPHTCLSYVMQEQMIGSPLDFHQKSGPAIWVSELIWREFYKMITFHFPRVCRHKPFQSFTDQLKWNTDNRLFNAWRQGQTGFPLVDAAMRQLNQTGWMHNRLRMVTAMFLSKILFLDWRLGEDYFSRHLIDGDLSANNGGWQWSASTGTDAAPYFRIFNPITQSERFDTEGEFIRQYCPELAGLKGKVIHDPFASGISVTELLYPQKIVDYKKMRAQTLAAFKSVHQS